MVSAKFNRQIDILEFRLVGNINLIEMLECINFRNENTTYPRSLKMLIDATNANFTFSVDDLTIIASENINAVGKYTYVFDAIILNNPKNTAFSMLFKEFSKTNNYKFSFFASKGAALKWLDNY